MVHNLYLKPSGAKAAKLTKDGAQALAIEALGYLAGDPARLSRFFALTGLTAENLRTAAREPGFLASVLDYFASDEALLLAFAKSGGHDPARVAGAHALFGATGESDLEIPQARSKRT